MEALQEILTLLVGENPELRLIISATLRMSFTSTLISCAIGLPLGVLMGLYEFRGKRLVQCVCNTLMGLPPVLAGLVTFFLLSRSGPFGSYKMLYSLTAMVIAQIMLITPIAAGLAAAAANSVAPRIRETAAGIGLGGSRLLFFTMFECRRQLFSVLFTGFGRAISEVGAAQIVGGNIQYKTRIMTTAIVLETNMGDFQTAAALGIVLLLIAFVILTVAYFLTEQKNPAFLRRPKRPR